jgi:hypothetical protein
MPTPYTEAAGGGAVGENSVAETNLELSNGLNSEQNESGDYIYFKAQNKKGTKICSEGCGCPCGWFGKPALLFHDCPAPRR